MPDEDRGKRLAPRNHTNAATSRDVPPPPETKDAIKERKARFEALNAFAQKHGGWIVSIPGDRFVDFQCLPGSQLPDQFRALGYKVQSDGIGERILHSAIIERFTRRADGELEPLTENSTKPIAETRTHAGICAVDKFFFLID
jgi:hypothetical protein